MHMHVHKHIHIHKHKHFRLASNGLWTQRAPVALSWLADALLASHAGVPYWRPMLVNELKEWPCVQCVE